MKYISGTIFGLIFSVVTLAVGSLIYNDWRPQMPGTAIKKSFLNDSEPVIVQVASSPEFFPVKIGLQQVAAEAPATVLAMPKTEPNLMTLTSEPTLQPVSERPQIVTTKLTGLAPVGTTAIKQIILTELSNNMISAAVDPSVTAIRPDAVQNAAAVPSHDLPYPPPGAEAEQAKVNEALAYMLSLEKTPPAPALVSVTEPQANELQGEIYKSFSSSFKNGQK
jgi:hypothetical protein